MNILIALHILITFALIGVILLQKGESGGLMQSSQGSMFTARGSANFLTKITGILATLFFGNCIIMTIVSSHQVKKADILEKAMPAKISPVKAEPAKTVPAKTK